MSSRQHSTSLRLDGAARYRVRRLLQRPPTRESGVLVGTLVEADFDAHTARLRTAPGETVAVRFDAALDDDVQGALRNRAQLAGSVTYDPLTSTARRVDLVEVSAEQPLPFDPGSFWAAPSVQDLAREQSISPAILDAPLMVLSDTERAELASAFAELDG